jgi:hypothetical protein
MHVTLAKLILETAHKRECSYSTTLGKYRLDMQQAAELVCEKHPELAEPVNLLLSNSWNQAIDWARAQKCI